MKSVVGVRALDVGRRLVPGVFVLWIWGGLVVHAGEPLFTSAYRSVDVGFSPQGVALGDLNGDGHLDLAVAHRGRDLNRAGADSVLSVFWGDGHAGFEWKADYAIGLDPRAVAIHDLDKDGQLDVIVACRGSHSIVTWFGVGEGLLGRQRRFASGLRPIRFAIEDFDRDGHPDLAVVHESTGPRRAGLEAAMLDPVEGDKTRSGSVAFLYSDSKDLLKLGPKLVTGHSPVALAVGLLDHDTRVDVVVAHQASRKLSILSGGDPAFESREDLQVQGEFVDVVIGDWDGEGGEDLIAAMPSRAGRQSTPSDGPEPGTDLVLVSTLEGKRSIRTFQVPGKTLTRLGLVDLDLDGALDLVALGEGEVLVFSGSKPEPFSSSIACKLDSRPSWFAIGKLNADEWPDLVTSSNGLAVSILLGNGDGSFGSRDEVATGLGPSDVLVLDTDRDGRGDLVVANQQSETVSVSRADASGGFAEKIDHEVGSRPLRVESEDLDGDGVLDLVVLGVRGASSEISLLRGRGDGTFEPRVRLVAGADPASLLLEDVNQDGKIDLIVPKRSFETILLYRAEGDGTYGLPDRIPLEHLPSAVATGDLNGDNRVDLVAADSRTRVVTVLLGQGDATFESHSKFRLRHDPGSLVIEDFTGDGTADLLIGPLALGEVGSVLTGQGDGSFGKRFDFETGPGSGPVSTGDLDGDATLDLVVRRRRANVVSVLLGAGDGQFATRQDYATGLIPTALCIADLNGDDRPDLAVTNSDSTLSILWNRHP